MKQILLDTSFILSCIRNKLDFFERLNSEGYSILIPEGVINEIKKFEKSKSEAKTAAKLLEQNKGIFKITKLIGKTVDSSIIKYAKENPYVIIATLDREIKNKIKNDKMVIRQRKTLKVV